MALRPEAFFDKGEFSSANTNFVYDSNCSLQYLTAVLNSKLMSVLYEGYFGALIMQSGYFQFQAPQLRVLPVPKIVFPTLESERGAALDNVLQSIKSGGTLSEIVRWAEEELHWNATTGYSGTGRNDTVHDLLSHLAVEMASLHEERVEIEQTWRAWVKAILPSNHNLTKAFLEQGWVDAGLESGWEGIKAEFQVRNAIPSGKDLQRLKRETEEALEELEPLYERIQRTDELIDQIVYRLYGLTEEEITVVETRAAGK